MISGFPSAEDVLDDLGDKVVEGLALMVARIRADLTLYRTTFPGWVADATDRGLLNWCHDRAWAHTVGIFDGTREVSFVDRPPTRELYVGTRYRLRVKKHDIEGAISTYLTQGALDFLEQEPMTLDGLEEIRLIAGYRWDPELREVGAAVISLRDGHDRVIWMHELDEPAGGAVAMTTPILPTTGPRPPQIAMGSDSHGSDSEREHRPDGGQPR